MGLDDVAAFMAALGLGGCDSRGDKNLAARWDREAAQARQLFIGHGGLGSTVHEA